MKVKFKPTAKKLWVEEQTDKGIPKNIAQKFLRFCEAPYPDQIRMKYTMFEGWFFDGDHLAHLAPNDFNFTLWLASPELAKKIFLKSYGIED